MKFTKPKPTKPKTIPKTKPKNKPCKQNPTNTTPQTKPSKQPNTIQNPSKQTKIFENNRRNQSNTTKTKTKTTQNNPRPAWKPPKTIQHPAQNPTKTLKPAKIEKKKLQAIANGFSAKTLHMQHCHQRLANALPKQKNSLWKTVTSCHTYTVIKAHPLPKVKVALQKSPKNNT